MSPLLVRECGSMACSVAAMIGPLRSGSTYLSRLAASIWSWPTLPPSWTSWWPSATGRLTPTCWGHTRRKSGFVMAVTWPLSWETCSVPSVGMMCCPPRTMMDLLRQRLQWRLAYLHPCRPGLERSLPSHHGENEVLLKWKPQWNRHSNGSLLFRRQLAELQKESGTLLWG